MQIYVVKGGQQTGPFSEGQLESMLCSGMVSLTDLAWHVGLSEWLPLHEVLDVRVPVGSGANVAPVPAEKGSTSAVGSRATKTEGVFLYIPIGRLVVMSILTLGFYDVYWIFRNWRFFKERDGLRIWPFWRGIFSYFFLSSLLEKIKSDTATNRGVPAPFSSGGLATGWIILTLVGGILCRQGDPVAYLVGLLLSAPAFCFLLPVQRHINAINEALPIRPAYCGWSVGHIVCVAHAIVLWLMLIVGQIQ
jgi:hypothetical protein